MMRPAHRTIMTFAAVACAIGACSASPTFEDPEQDSDSVSTSSPSGTDSGSDQGSDTAPVQPEALLVLVPPPQTPAAALAKLGQRLAAHDEGRVQVEVLDFGGVLPSPQLVAERVSKLAQQVNEPGLAPLEPEDIVLVGVGAAAQVAAQVSASSSYGGLVLLGASGQEPVVPLAKPLLVVSGELDGLYSPFAWAAANAAGVATDLSMSVVLGANHGQLLGGASIAGDLPAAADDSDVLDQVAASLSVFLRARGFLSGSEADAQQAEAQLEQLATAAQSFFAPFVEASTYESQTWCLLAQVAVGRLPTGQADRLEAQVKVFEDSDSFYEQQPSLEVVQKKKEPSHAKVMALHLVGLRQEADSPWISGRHVACKLKSEVAIWESLEIEPVPEGLSCAELNEAAVRYAIESAPSEVLTRYEEAGARLVLMEDNSMSTGSQWAPSELSWQWEATEPPTVFLRSPALVTSTWVPVFGGMRYCKLLSPASAVEWVWRESLRQPPSL